jgi:transcriptional regulator with XRE-family HTH domain
MVTPQSAKEWVAALRTWYHAGGMRQKDLAAALALSPQSLNEILAGRNQPTGDQIVRIIEFMKTLDSKSPAIGRDPSQPQTLAQAKEMLSAAREQLAQLRGGSPAIAIPTIGPKLAAEPAEAGQRIGNVVANRTAAEKAQPKPQLPASADTPVAITALLDKENLEGLLALLANPDHSQLQASMIFTEVKKRRAIVAGRFIS